MLLTLMMGGNATSVQLTPGAITTYIGKAWPSARSRGHHLCAELTH
jgi:hypothetical protein